MLAALDPLGMPTATLVVPGNAADDSLYEPALRQARRVVGQGGRLYIGDSKMAALYCPVQDSALWTRAFLQAGGDYYLTPLPPLNACQRATRAVGPVVPVCATARPALAQQ